MSNHTEKSGRYYLLAVIVWLLTLSLYGQKKWDIQQFGTAQGLADRTVLRTVKDTFGYRWLATETGVQRFDGHRFDRPPFLEKLQQENTYVIREMMLDHFGRIVCWDGVSNYLKLINSRTNEVAKLVLPNKQQSDTSKTHFLLQYPHPVYAHQITGEQNNVYKLTENGDWQKFLTTTLNTASENINRYLGQSPDKRHFFYDSDRALVIAIAADGQKRTIPLEITKEPLLLQLDSQGRLWLQANDDTQLKSCPPEGSAFEPYIPLARTDSIRYNKFYEDNCGNLILGAIARTSTSALVLLKNDGTIENLGKILRKEKKITAISGEDFQQGFDLSTYSGYFRIRRPIARLSNINYLDSDTFDPNKYDGYILRGFAETTDGTLYGNTEGGIWFRLKKPDYKLDTFYPYADDKPLLKTQIGSGHNMVALGHTVYGLHHKNTKDGRQGYLISLDTKSNQWANYPLPLKGIYGRFVLALPDDDLLIFTTRRSDRIGRIYRFDPVEKTFSFFASFDSDLPKLSRSSTYNALYDEQRKLVWMASKNGLSAFKLCFQPEPCYFDSTNAIRYPEINFPIQSFLLDADNNLLLGTYGEGVQVFNPETRKLSVFAYNNSQRDVQGKYIDLPSNLIAEVVRLDSLHLAITTFKGMVVANIESRRTQFYDTNDGLPQNEFNRLSAFLSSQGELLVGGVNGFSRIPKSTLLARQLGPTPRLSRYYTFDEDQLEEQQYYPRPDQNHEIVVPPGQVYLGFNFITPGVEGATYRSWLEGYETDFGPVNKSAEVEYLRVGAGNYTLHVEAANALGESSAKPFKIPIRVQQPWYLRPWFLVLSQLALIGIGFLIYRNRVNRIRAQEAEKTRVSRQLADMEMKILRQQLNPHFIFNALGAIQHFIQSMRGPDAMEYLADFAKLMRMFLESSKQSFIFLVDELKLIKLYIRLEQLRFNNKFDVVYDIDPELDLDMEDIPSLLLQPFVENAINHGIFHLKRRGTLTIGMKMDDQERIICTISDDGIGRKAAAELRKKTYKQHKSRATQIVEERLDIFQRSGDTDVEIITEDLYPDREETGTKVTIIVDAS